MFSEIFTQDSYRTLLRVRTFIIAPNRCGRKSNHTIVGMRHKNQLPPHATLYNLSLLPQGTSPGTILRAIPYTSLLPLVALSTLKEDGSGEETS